ncbi:MAG: signal peptidase I [Clostridiaceae bacterium]|nr:signal peptidase I [Clostridiaceae bacterium]
MKKILSIMQKVLVSILVVAAVSMMIFTIISVSTFDRSNRELFGYKAFIVLSDSMSKTDFSAGDLIFVRSVDPSLLKEGDIISFISTNSNNYGQTITHKIRKKTIDSNGDPGFITYGTTTGVDDEQIVTYPYILGKYQFHLAGVGRFFMFLKTTPGYVLFIFIPFMLLILNFGIRSVRLFREYKKEQREELQAEREKIEAEREEARRMMEELMKLKAELSGLQKDPTVYDGQAEVSNDGEEAESIDMETIKDEMEHTGSSLKAV